MQILVIDDALSERMMITSLLEDMGHQVLAADDGQSGLDHYLKYKPDLVLLDVNMPVMDGYSAAQRMRESQDSWVPIIFLSACTEPDDVATGIAAGGDDYLAKPIDPVVLAAKMEAMQRIAEMRQRLIDVSSALEQANGELRRLANVDGLTNVANRRYLDQRIDEEIRACMRWQTPLCVVMVDIDHFKAYNDQFGHVAGDSCLKKVAKVLSRGVNRTGACVARYGGEEFCILLPETSAEEALELAERLRQDVLKLGIPAPAEAGGRLSCSFGLYAEIPFAGMGAAGYLKQADQALYQAKRNGRNRSHRAA